jgi:DNA-3-methyladenine glycosylase
MAMHQIEIADLQPLPRNYFDGDVETVAKALIGTFLVTIDSGGNKTGGKIVETEAYDQNDPAAHCHPSASKRRQEGSRAMLRAGGDAYVFPDRQMYCLNFTTGTLGFGSAVLIRALEPTFGLDIMRARRREWHQAKYLNDEARYQNYLCNGPCNLCEALAVTITLNEQSLFLFPFELYARNPREKSTDVVCGPRVNVPRAEDLPRRYALAGSKFISKLGVKRYPLSADHYQ